MTFPSKNVTYLVEKEPGIWARGLVENVLQSSKGYLAKLVCTIACVDYYHRNAYGVACCMVEPCDLHTYVAPGRSVCMCVFLIASAHVLQP